MLQLRGTRILKTAFETLATGVSIQEEGCALVYVKENGDTKVALSTGTGVEKLAGLAIARNMPPAYYPVYEKITLNSSAQGTLTKAPATINSVIQLMLKSGSTVYSIVTIAPTSASQIELTGSTIQADASLAGATVYAQYLYMPTVLEAQTILGMAPYGGLAANALGTVGVVKQGECSMSFFDASQDWTNVMYAKLGAGGTFTPATSSTGITNVTVKNTPSEADPFLHIELNLG
jgi:hypothetical protein